MNRTVEASSDSDTALRMHMTELNNLMNRIVVEWCTRYMFRARDRNFTALILSCEDTKL